MIPILTEIPAAAAGAAPKAVHSLKPYTPQLRVCVIMRVEDACSYRQVSRGSLGTLVLLQNR